ncbi:hypothetical protein OG693_39095 (plasmid) [Streptomyces sp. NBC_01259]|uniref:hypothetical protein n=1 Tax=Streptomyces sp. NBC_01259 TaxID=2903800 RepID=UPI002F91641F
MNIALPSASKFGQHQMAELHQDAWKCASCGVVAISQYNPQTSDRINRWMDWRAPDGRDWMTWPGGDEEPPSCPLPGVEALCPWEDYAQRYAGPKGDVQLDTAMRTWCDRHDMVVADCPEPGPYCPGADAHADGEEGQPGPCTGRENSCKCMCPACCGDTPDMYGYDGDY